MTQQEYENEIKELKERLEKLEMAKVEDPQSKRWKPGKNMKYWHVNNKGFCSYMYYINDSYYDNWNYLTGNCFKTKKEAEYYKKKIEYTARYKNYIEQHSEPIDWNGYNDKYYAAFNFDEAYKTIGIFSVCTHKIQGTIYASSKQIIEDAIKEIGEDNFKKYVLKVK